MSPDFVNETLHAQNCQLESTVPITLQKTPRVYLSTYTSAEKHCDKEMDVWYQLQILNYRLHAFTGMQPIHLHGDIFKFQNSNKICPGSSMTPACQFLFNHQDMTGGGVHSSVSTESATLQLILWQLLLRTERWVSGQLYCISSVCCGACKLQIHIFSA